MSERNVLIIGAGARMQSTALPVLEKMKDSFSIHRIFDKSDMKIRSKETEYEAAAFESFSGDDLSGADLVYVAVNKDKVPTVLSKLCRYDTSEKDLLVETPVLLFKHFRYAGLLQRFRNVWVAEDCVQLPCFDVVREAMDNDTVGALKEVTFHQSAYKYHGLAMLKTWLDCSRVTRARRKGSLRNLYFSNGTLGLMYEPRDYDKGWFSLKGSKGTIADAREEGAENYFLEPEIEHDACTGFRIKEMTSRLNEDEVDLMGKAENRVRVTSLMDDMKRVGFYRWMKRIHEGKGGYPVSEALDDMVIDYYLDKVGFYSANPLMSVKSGFGFFLLKSITRVLSR